MKDQSAGFPIKERVGFKLKIYSFLVDNSEHKKEKRVNRNGAATVSHNNNIKMFC